MSYLPKQSHHVGPECVYLIFAGSVRIIGELSQSNILPYMIVPRYLLLLPVIFIL